MASIFKKPDCKNWIACFRDKEGRQMRLTTREPNRQKAKQIADLYERTARGPIRKRDFRELVNGLYQRLYGAPIEVTTMRAYTKRWLITKKSEICFKTWNCYDRVLREFLSFLGGAADEDIADVTKTQVVEFRDKLSADVAASTANLYMVGLKYLFKSAKRDGYLSDSPAEFVAPVKMAGPIVKRRAFTSEELQRVLAAADLEERSMILFGVFTGQRLGDICTLKWENIDLERGIIHLVTIKTKKQMRIPIAAALRDHIASLPGTDDPQTPIHPWFCSQYSRGGEKRTSSSMHGRLDHLFVNAGLRKPKTAKMGKRPGKGQVNDLTFHSLRHTTVSLLKDAGVPDAVVMELVGHDTVEMSQHYTHTGLDALRTGIEKLPSL
jgi:integrase